MIGPLRRSIDVGHRGSNGVAFAFLIGSLAMVPLALALTGTQDFDVIRWFVFTQIAVVIGLFGYSLVKETKRIWAKRYENTTSRTISIARNCRYTGIIIILATDGWQVIERVNNDEINLLTPLTQLALVFFVITWGLLDRRPVVDTPGEVSEVLREMKTPGRRHDDLR